MKNVGTILLSLSLFIFGTVPATASWYEVTGSAAVVSSESQAKLYALEDAVYKAISFSGADIGSISNLYPLLDAQRTEFQFTNHEVRYILVEEQTVKNNVAYVKVRIDIYPSASGCQVEQYKKTVLVSNITLASPQQAVMGQIYKIGDDFSQVLNKQLDKESHSFISVGTTDYEVDKNYPARLKMIAEDNNAQYIIAGNITDLTATIAAEPFGDEVINRQFAMDLSVFDGETGNAIINRNYREIARWPFPRTSQVDTKSARFWASTYGEMLLRLSRHIMLDLESELSCKITLPEVISKSDHIVMMNLGRIHGVQKGDKLQLWHTGSFIDQRGLARNKVTQSDITLTVDRVYETEAELSVDQAELADSIQIGDVMHKQLIK
ncbi:flagellar assembly protein FlgT [Vibrio gazogenes]|uniref:Flagellar basal-body protein n=1 Tax=Vibrio gazogenes TaxID=687 RepID=A0A1Z2SD14_VIBGA|nr:flagellar assembly protein FlgT [Vibrio gazogenes]ASA55058.1 flagellar basal-body protein [Vibrio gazogenes]